MSFKPRYSRLWVALGRTVSHDLSAQQRRHVLWLVNPTRSHLNGQAGGVIHLGRVVRGHTRVVTAVLGRHVREYKETELV